MTEQEKGILEATKEFAEIHNIPYDNRIESMILNAMREVIRNYSTPVVIKSFGCGWNFCDAVLNKKGVVKCGKCNRYE